MTEEMSISTDTFRDWLELSRRDDCLDKLVPSDIRLMLGEITRQRREIIELKHAIALKDTP